MVLMTEWMPCDGRRRAPGSLAECYTLRRA